MGITDEGRRGYLDEYFGRKPGEKSWQDNNYRERVFGWLVQALKDEDMLSSGEHVWFPAANSQHETKLFSEKFPWCRFVGGDIVKSAVYEGKLRGGDSAGNAVLTVADAFNAPVKNFDAIIDFAGAAWYASELANTDMERLANVNRIFCEYHKALKNGGCVMIDGYTHEMGGHYSTMDIIRMNFPELYETMKSGSVKFRTGERTYKVEAGMFKTEAYEAEFKVRELYVRSNCNMWILEKA